MTLQELEKAIAELPSEEFSQLRSWFLAFDAKHWDEQFETDVAEGKLDQLADEAIGEHQEGETTRL